VNIIATEAQTTNYESQADSYALTITGKPGAFNLITITPTAGKSTFRWGASARASEYILCRKDTSKPKDCDDIANSTTTSAVVNGLGAIKNLTSVYFVIAKNHLGEMASNEKSVTPNELSSLIQYFKASNTGVSYRFGNAVALSSDGNTMAVGAYSDDTYGLNAGAVYIFRYSGSAWTEEASIRASNARADSYFGEGLALSSDGNTLAVGAKEESSSGLNAGAVYIFRYSGSAWTEEQFITASNKGKGDYFGGAVALSSDGNTLAVGAHHEDSGAKYSGAAYLFRYSSGSAWTEEAFIKASNLGFAHNFGNAVALSSDGNTLAVGANEENGTGLDDAGAVYIYRYSVSAWTESALIRASNTGKGDLFGSAVALSSDGNTLAVGAYGEASNGTGVNSGTQANNSGGNGAAYLFRYSALTWTQEAYIKPFCKDCGYSFGYEVALSSDGNTLAVGAYGDNTMALGIGNHQANNLANGSGAVFLYRYSTSAWTEGAFIKASNTDVDDKFGIAVALSSDGNTLAVGAMFEDSSGTGINSGAQASNGTRDSGAVYLY